MATELIFVAESGLTGEIFTFRMKSSVLGSSHRPSLAQFLHSDLPRRNQPTHIGYSCLVNRLPWGTRIRAMVWADTCKSCCTTVFPEQILRWFALRLLRLIQTSFCRLHGIVPGVRVIYGLFTWATTKWWGLSVQSRWFRSPQISRAGTRLRLPLALKRLTDYRRHLLELSVPSSPLNRPESGNCWTMQYGE